MTVEEKFQELLEAAPGVTDLAPAERIKVPGDWQGLARPYIIHFPVTVQPTNAHDGPQALRVWPEYQVSFFAETYGAARALADAVVAALNGHRDEVTDSIMLLRPPLPLEDFDTDRKIQHFACGFRVAGALT